MSKARQDMTYVGLYDGVRIRLRFVVTAEEDRYGETIKEEFFVDGDKIAKDEAQALYARMLVEGVVNGRS